MVDTTIGDRAIAAGDRIILLYPSANRDESVFEDPFRFDVTRSPNPHVAFGYGTHFCIGANLARFELGLLFAELVRRFEPPEVISELGGRAQHIRPLGPQFPRPARAETRPLICTHRAR